MLQTKPATFTATKASRTPWCVQMRWPGTTQRNHALVQVCVLISEVLGKKGAISADTSLIVLDPLRSFTSRCHEILWKYPFQSTEENKWHIFKTFVMLRLSQCWFLYIITCWQIKANLNTEEGEKKYTRGKVRQIGRECVIWKIVNFYSVFQRNFDEYFSSLCLIFISSNRLSESIIKGVVVQPVTMNNLVRKTLSINRNEQEFCWGTF